MLYVYSVYSVYSFVHRQVCKRSRLFIFLLSISSINAFFPLEPSDESSGDNAGKKMIKMIVIKRTCVIRVNLLYLNVHKLQINRFSYAEMIHKLKAISWQLSDLIDIRIQTLINGSIIGGRFITKEMNQRSTLFIGVVSLFSSSFQFFSIFHSFFFLIRCALLSPFQAFNYVVYAHFFPLWKSSQHHSMHFHSEIFINHSPNVRQHAIEMRNIAWACQRNWVQIEDVFKCYEYGCVLKWIPTIYQSTSIYFRGIIFPIVVIIHTWCSCLRLLFIWIVEMLTQIYSWESQHILFWIWWWIAMFRQVQALL